MKSYTQEHSNTPATGLGFLVVHLVGLWYNIQVLLNLLLISLLLNSQFEKLQLHAENLSLPLLGNRPLF